MRSLGATRCSPRGNDAEVFHDITGGGRSARAAPEIAGVISTKQLQELEQRLLGESEALRSRVDAMLQGHIARQSRTVTSYVPCEAKDARAPPLHGDGAALKLADGSTSFPSQGRGAELSPPESSVTTTESKRFSPFGAPLDGGISFSSEQSTRPADLRHGAFDTVLSATRWFESIREPKRHGCLADFILSHFWARLCTLVIGANAIFAIVAADYDLNHYLEQQNVIGDGMTTIAGIDLAFFLFYTIEIILKFIVHKQYFFCNHDWKWNALDLGLVVSNALSSMSSLAFQTSEAVDLTFMRSVRVLKLARVLRIVRMVRFVDELRLIMNSVMGSFVSLFWSLVVVAFIVYMFAIVFCQGIVAHYKDAGEPLPEDVVHMFGSVERAMLTLYAAANNGYDWEVVYEVLRKTGTNNAILFLCFIVFIQLAVLNIVTGIFVENAMKLAQPDNEVSADLRALLASTIDASEHSRITSHIFARAYGASPKLRSRLNLLGLEVKDPKVFFRMLAALEDDRTLDIDSVVKRSLWLRGSASSIQLHHLILETREQQKLVNGSSEQCILRLDELEKHLERREAAPSAHHVFGVTHAIAPCAGEPAPAPDRQAQARDPTEQRPRRPASRAHGAGSSAPAGERPLASALAGMFGAAGAPGPACLPVAS